MTLLNSLRLPDDIQTLSTEELETLADEIRHTLVLIGDQCGGHLASNLGVVELTLALHATFKSPRDKFVFDVSHQCYVHKMLTGRLDKMFTIRQDNGLSGFAKIDESEHDAFGAGHASTSLSAALGIAQARDILEDSYSVVSIVGDATFSGGMAFEALNNIEKLDPKSNFICILNDNDMSISPPVGNMATYMTQIRTSPLYNSAKDTFDQIFKNIPKIGEPLKRRVEKAMDHMRDIIIDQKIGVIFEEFGFKYLGPIDGHNITTLMAALKYAKSYEGPIMIHINTTKGKGHELAEADPVKYHGVSPKKAASAVSATTPKQPTYTEVFGNKIIELAEKDKKVVVITPAMKSGSGLVAYADRFPKRFFDVGIAEEHAVTYAAGLARAGVKPILAIYSTFLQRGYDQVIHDVCIQKLPVIFALDRAGLVGEDGPTHHGCFDIAFLQHIPNLVVLAPKDGHEMETMLEWAVQSNKAVAIRYPKGNIPDKNGTLSTPFSTPKAELMKDFRTHPSEKADITLLALGSMAWEAYDAAEELAKEGITAIVVNIRSVKPLDIDCIDTYVQQSAATLVIEEGCEIGGVFSAILKETQSDLPRKQWHNIGIPDTFIEHGKLATLRRNLGLDKDGIVKKVKAIIHHSITV